MRRAGGERRLDLVDPIDLDDDPRDPRPACLPRAAPPRRTPPATAT